MIRYLRLVFLGLLALSLIAVAIANRDIVVVRDVVMLLAAVVIVVNFAVDVLYALVDPRLRTGDAA